VALTLVIGLIWSNVNQAYAQRLLNASDVTQNITNLIGPNEVMYYETIIEQRADLTITEPNDPYHLPVIPFYNGKRVIERWIGIDTAREVIRPESARNIVLSEVVTTPTTISFYDARSGLAYQSARSKSVSPQQPDSKNTIDGVKTSIWGTNAWIIKSEPTSISPNAYKVASHNLAQQPPFASDLKFDKVQVVREVDQKSGLLVSITLNALTPSGPVALYLETNAIPKAIPLSQLPNGWDKLSVSVSPDIPPNASGTTTGDNQKAVAVAKTIGFPVYLPAKAALEKVNPAFDRSDTIYNPHSSYTLPSPIAFDLYKSVTMGIGVHTIYLSSHPVDPTHPKAISIIQGPKADLIPHLTQGLPLWQRSKPAKFNVTNKEGSGWILQGGLLREAGDNPLIGLVFETDSTLIYLEGQNVDENALIELASSLQIANPK